MAKYLKYLLPYSTQLSSGRKDVTTIACSPNQLFDYDTLVIEDRANTNYNKFLIDTYINDNILCLLTIADSGPDPIITVHPANFTVNNTGDATFTVVATGTQPMSYAWYQNDILVPGEATSTLVRTITGLGGDEGDNGDTIYAIVSNARGSAQSTTAILTIDQA